TAAKIFEADFEEREKYFINFPFPYVNGSPHLGHGYSLMKAEIMARYQRMLGKNVLFPFGFHATGEPIAGMAKRLKAGDENQIKAMALFGIPESEIAKFYKPKHIVEYFIEKWIHAIKVLGIGIDWRRKFVTTTLTPTFSKFVEWQYRRLKRDGHVIQGSHPVIWCPTDLNPTGDHDRLEGEGVRIVDFALMKFRSEKFDAFFLPATLRPETVFGVTNMFINPDALYVKMTIGPENYVVAQENVIKFRDQQFEISNVQPLDINEIIGSYLTNPATGNDVIILPGEFIDAGGATGVVMSVPAHAPVDWVVLIELQKKGNELNRWNITDAEIKAIQPICLIKVENYGEFPAGEAVDEFDINSMDDPKLKQATRLIYRKEHNTGILTDITGKYSGKLVSEIKDILLKDFEDDGKAFLLKDPADLVICRCGTRNHVKYLENQWFLEFSNPEWKQSVHEMINNMAIFPEEARLAFHKTVDWLENKACARRSGMGTPMPWDPDWIIETLSDSVIYMAYYIISKYVNSGQFKLKYAVDEIFDYIVLGEGDPVSITATLPIPKKLLCEIRKEMDYFYGFDLRSSGKDLLTNHLTYMLMHHNVFFEKKYWPKAIAVNGYVSIIKPGSLQAVKMSKSKANFTTIEDAVEIYGVDATRIGFAIAGEQMKDAQFQISEAESYVRWLQNLYSMAFESIDDQTELQIDQWLMSRIQNQINKANHHLSIMETRSAFQAIHHEILQDVKWYIRRRETKGPAYKYAIETIVKLICPYAPHFAEEVWEQMGNDEFIISTTYPEADESKINMVAEYGEKYILSLLDDIQGLIRFLTDKGNPNPTKIEIFISPEWKYEVYQHAYSNGLKNLIKRVMQIPEMRKLGKPVLVYSKSLVKAGGPPEIPWSYQNEMTSIDESVEFLGRQTKAEIEVIAAENSNHPKAKGAVPRRPGINFVFN
ncbi:MAG: leucine--tRNA ligase, partial [Candidatus Heimdallarchaeota archaeon]|nr:leucine--tRNA ligase [Candidatus Heimdallarchaeota archaeon]